MNRRATVLGTDSAGNLVLQLADSHLGTAPVPRPIVGSSTTGLHTAPPVGAQVLLLHEGEHMTPLPAAAVTASERLAGALAELRPGETALLGPDGRVALLLDRAGNIALASGSGGQGTLDGQPLLTAAELNRREELEMRWAGEFVSDGHYYFGDVVRAAAATYVCKMPPRAVTERRLDTFARPDQADFGTASDGHVWDVVYRAAPALDSITSNAGLAQCFGAGNSDNLRLGPAMPGADVELLVRWQVATGVAPTDGVMLWGNISAGGGTYAFAAVTLDGGVQLGVADSSHTATGAWAGTTAGQKVWTRARLQAGTWSVRSWLDGGTEPTAWDVDWESGAAVIPDGVGLACGAANAGAVLSCDHFEATTVGAATPWPAYDADHWDLMAGA